MPRQFAVLSVLLLLLLPWLSFGDGCFVWQKGVDLNEPEQRAIILYHEGVEDLILQVKYGGDVADFAWIVPLPAVPEVAAVPGACYAELSEYTQRRGEWFAWSGFMRMGLGGDEPAVKVIERKRVGVFDLASVEARDGEALERWLKANGFAVPEKASAVFADYVEREWVFCALRVAPEARDAKTVADLRAGRLDPVRFTFASERPVYPLKISSLNAGESEVLLYVLADEVLVSPSFTVQAPELAEFYYGKLPIGKGWVDEASKQRFAERFDAGQRFYRKLKTDELPHTRQVLPRMGERAWHLTKLRRTFEVEEMVEDIVLRPVKQLSPEDRLAFVRRQVGRGEFTNALLLHVREATRTHLGEILAKHRTYKEDVRCVASGFGALAVDPAEEDLDFLRKAAAHETDWVASAVPGALVDRCHQQDADRLLPVIAAAMERRSTNGLYDACDSLAAIGTPEAWQMLRRAVLEDPGEEKEWGRHYRLRHTAICTLARQKESKWIATWEELFDRHRESLGQDDISILAGALKQIGDPAAIPLAERVEAFCKAKEWANHGRMIRETLIHLRFKQAAPEPVTP